MLFPTQDRLNYNSFLHLQYAVPEKVKGKIESIFSRQCSIRGWTGISCPLTNHLWTIVYGQYFLVDDELKIVCPIPGYLATFGTSKTEKYQFHRAHHDQVQLLQFKNNNPVNLGYDNILG